MADDLELWTTPDQLGDTFSVKTPGGDGRVTLNEPLTAYGATNNSNHDVELYATNDQTGEPVQSIGGGQTAPFLQRQSVQSVKFV
ncbi:hypothetical protein ABZW10_04110 [Kitasatospora sp. NPDC004723]|uniref:hypothetical protein n=1 Tax=Kitasatospora sp. NPDC004723 TaxID=3154288 RepID=UPI0033B055BF